MSRQAVHGAAAWLERRVGQAVDFAAVGLLLAETGLLLAGVVARYVFHAPIVWSDELAGAIFLWLSMFGAVIAMRRGEHMAFAALSGSVGPAARRVLRTLALVCVLAFLLLLVGPALDYIDDESFAVLPNLGIASSWRVSGIGVGLVLLCLYGVAALVREASGAALAISLAVVAACAGGLWLGAPALQAIGNLNLLVFFVGMVGVSIAIGVPIGFAFGLATLAYLGLTTDVPLSVVVNRLDQGMSQPLLLAIPMFIFLGLLIDLAGLARAMIVLLASLLGSVRGGLYYVLLVAMILVSGISGSKAADMAAIAPGLFPEMKRRGASEADLVALLGAAAAMADTIPPSLVLITFGSVTGVSIAALFTAGLIPALVLASALAALVFVRARKEPRPPRSWPGLAAFGRQSAVALPALVLPFVIRAAVVEGVATATEVSTLGIAYALLCGTLIYRPFPWARLRAAMVESAALSGAVLFVIGTANGMAWALTQSGFSADLARLMLRVSAGPGSFLAITAVVFVLLGNVLEGIPAILLFGPLLLPVSRAMGVHDVQYAMVVVIAMSIGLFAPPFGVGFYAACAIGKVRPEQAARRIWTYLLALSLALALIAAVPWLSTALLR